MTMICTYQFIISLIPAYKMLITCTRLCHRLLVTFLETRDKNISLKMSINWRRSWANFPRDRLSSEVSHEPSFAASLVWLQLLVLELSAGWRLPPPPPPPPRARGEWRNTPVKTGLKHLKHIQCFMDIFLSHMQ